MRHRFLAVLTVAVITVGLAACASSEAEPQATRTPKPSPTAVAPTQTADPEPSSSPEPSASAPPASKPGAQATLVTIGCDQLLSPQAVYDYNPNFSLQSGFTPAAGTPAAQAVAHRGVACSWVNQTSGVTFEVSVARPGSADLASLRDSAASGARATGVGDAAYFVTNGGVGTAHVFSEDHWLVATSPGFYVFDDAAPLLRFALGAVGR